MLAAAKEPDRLRFGACRPDAASFVLSGSQPLSSASFAHWASRKTAAYAAPSTGQTAEPCV